MPKDATITKFDDLPDLLTIRDVARYLQVSENTAWMYATTGDKLDLRAATITLSGRRRRTLRVRKDLLRRAIETATPGAAA